MPLLFCGSRAPEHRATRRAGLGLQTQLLGKTEAAWSVRQEAHGGQGGLPGWGGAPSADPPEAHKANISPCVQTTEFLSAKGPGQ